MSGEAVRLCAPPTYRFAILGAGLAGLSLARSFARNGISGRIALIDAKSSFIDDRTWSFWDVDKIADASLAAASWHRWQLLDESGTYEQQSQSISYVSITTRSFYATALAEIRTTDADWFLGERVTGIEEHALMCTIRTTERTISAEYVFDARGLTAAMTESVDVVQRFAGYRIETTRDTFDPGVATLMDVQSDTSDGFHFFYLLPFSAREALVENTYFARRPIGRARLERELDTYIERRFEAARPVITYREAGALPMSSRLSLPQRTFRTIPIGLRGGCARPGSGYTFQRVQRQVERIARAFAEPEGAIEGIDFRASAPWYDAVLLAAAHAAPNLLPHAFRQLFASIAGDSLARFMMDRADPLETLPVLLASAIGAGQRMFARSPSRPAQRHRLASR